MVDLFTKAMKNIDSNNLPSRTESIKRYLNRRRKKKETEKKSNPTLSLYHETISGYCTQKSLFFIISYYHPISFFFLLLLCGPPSINRSYNIKLVIRLVLSVRREEEEKISHLKFIFFFFVLGIYEFSSVVCSKYI